MLAEVDLGDPDTLEPGFSMTARIGHVAVRSMDRGGAVESE